MIKLKNFIITPKNADDLSIVNELEKFLDDLKADGTINDYYFQFEGDE